MFKLGCRILQFNAVLFILLGVYAVLFNNTPLFLIINWIMDPTFWNGEELSDGTIKFKIFTWDLLGMFHILWGINIFCIVKYCMVKDKFAWAWKCLLMQVVVWLSVMTYFTISIKKNTSLPITIFLAILFIAPLIMTRDILKAKHSDN